MAIDYERYPNPKCSKKNTVICLIGLKRKNFHTFNIQGAVPAVAWLLVGPLMPVRTRSDEGESKKSPN